MCGRAGIIWDDVEDEEGVKELKKVGTKMKAEVETSYEPSLLVELERLSKSAKTGSQWIHRAWVIKDRFDTINGQCFDDPGFESFLRHIELLNLGGKHRAIEKDRDSQDIFNDDGKGEAKFRQIRILQEKIQKAVYRIHPGQTDKAKLGRDDVLKQAFGTVSWTEVCSMQKEDLESGLTTLEKQNKREVKHATT